MKLRLIKIVLLVWLGCYLSGPLAASFDSWDSPREELHDVQRNAGGAVTLVLAVFFVVSLLFRKWRERVLSAARRLAEQAATVPTLAPVRVFATSSASSHSPPSPLRV
ncbi:MAG TPA: hypothetical protein VGZ29_03395 [Terriglobia bacterium]|nr:hypothetical protein [Terriglobia bacterium]